jgi:hypothetical protein
MKTIYVSLAGAFALTGFLTFGASDSPKSKSRTSTEIVSCSSYDTIPGATIYRDLNSDEIIDIWYDASGLRTLNKKTGAPVEFYINTNTNDTVFGRGRFIVNGYVIKGENGKWKLNDAKVKVDGDELKVKVGDQKLKVDGDEIKVKGNGVKAKSESGDVKVKNKDGKAKYEDDKIKVKEGDNKTKVKDTTKSN